MDELVNLLDQTEVTTNNGLDATKAPRLSQWKEKTAKAGDQRERRRRRLEEIKKSRQAQFSQHRNLEPENEKENKNSENLPETFGSKKKRDKRVHENFKDFLMQSEWLVDIPEKFEEWIVLICPMGRRRLLNANFGKTCLFTKTGYQTRQTWSDLPGGNRNDSSDSHQTLLDGIHCESSNTFYVLDFVYWNGNRYQDCEFEFRRFWLAQKFSEINCQKNPNLKLQLAPAFEMNELKSKLQNDVTNLMHLEMDAEIPLIDGIMFYHRETPYINATTPLVGWLKPEHISEQFENIKTHPSFLLKPTDDKRKQFDVPSKLTREMN